MFVGYEQIAAHKVILSLRSQVFKDMFTNQTTEFPLNELVIGDYDAFVVRAFLSFVYKDVIDAFSLSVHAKELFAMASKYQVSKSVEHTAPHSCVLCAVADCYSVFLLQVKRLIAVCQDHLSSTLSTANAVDLLLLADQHGGQDLKCDAIEFVVTHFSEIFSAPRGEGGQTLSEKLGLPLCEEVFQAVAWRVLVMKDTPQLLSTVCVKPVGN